MELTLDNINNSSIIKICKILGVSLIPGKTLDDQYREEIKNTLILRGKYDGFNEILDFINKSGRNNINSFLFKVKKEIDKISSEDWYKNINLDEIKAKRANLEKLKENKLRSYAHTGNDKQYWLSIDIKSANFTMLREIGNILEDTWPKYLKRVYPNDVRTDRNRNVELGMNGLITEIPDCIYESKWFRQFLLSDLNKLPVLWEIKILELS